MSEEKKCPSLEEFVSIVRFERDRFIKMHRVNPDVIFVSPNMYYTIAREYDPTISFLACKYDKNGASLSIFNIPIILTMEYIDEFYFGIKV